MKNDFKEEDMYCYVREFLIGEGYNVRGEVKNCDIAANNGDELLIVELKKVFNLKLVYQTLDRLSLTDFVYAAIPRPTSGQNTKDFKNMIRLMRRLEIGIMTVAMDSPLKTVEVVLEAGGTKKYKNNRRKLKLENELLGRALDINNGGINKREILTAYKEKAIMILCVLDRLGSTTKKQLKENGFDDKTATILSSNYYKWYDRRSRGVYCVSEKGAEFLNNSENDKAIKYYRAKAAEMFAD